METRRRKQSGFDGYATSKQVILAAAMAFARETPRLRFNAIEPGFNPTTGALSSGSTLSIAVPNGQTMNLDLSNIRREDGSSMSRILAGEMRRYGFEYHPRKKLLGCEGRKLVSFPFQYLGADDQAGPNYTKQPVVDSYYASIGAPAFPCEPEA